MLKIKDKRAFIFYVVAVILLWQFGVTVAKLCCDSYLQVSTQNDPIFSFVLLKNTGGAFSLFSNHPYILCAFGAVTLIFIAAYVYKKITFEDKFKILSLVLFSAGIFGNMTERLMQGYVTDYIKLNFVNFAVFNLYDVMICTAVVLFILNVLIEDLILKNAKKDN